MPITAPDIVSEQGKSDAKRHRDKQKEVIKENLPHIIANENIITGKRNKIVKIPIKSLEIPRFKPGKSGDGVGIGQGEGEPGDIIGSEPGQTDSEPGSEPGQDIIETEIELEELIELMFEDLGLPKLEEKELKSILVELGYEMTGISRSGPWTFLDTKATGKEGLKRFYFFLKSLSQETGRSELACFDALKKTNGDYGDALELLRDTSFQPTAEKVEPFPVYSDDSLRFRKVEPDISYQSQAVIIAMRDVSGSMTTDKTYLARSMLFWLVRFLEKIYEHVEIRFIIHHALAKIVDEDTFFKTQESGGTFCYTAYELANGLVEAEYPTSQYNVYVWHFSDGEDYDTSRTVEEIKRLFAKKINMLGYGEIEPTEKYDRNLPDSDLMKAVKESFSIQQVNTAEITMISGKTEPLLGVVIQTKEQLLPALKEFLKKDRWSNG